MKKQKGTDPAQDPKAEAVQDAQGAANANNASSNGAQGANGNQANGANGNGANGAEGTAQAAEAQDVQALAAELAAAQKRCDEYLQLAQRVQADFDNFRRRNATTRTDARDEAVREVLTDLLPVLDNMELSVYHAEQAGESGALLEGSQKVLRHFQDLLHGKYGVEEIPAQGQPFDPTLHNAVMQAALEEGQSDGEIVEVFQKGFRTQDRVLRYSMVKVAKE